MIAPKQVKKAAQKRKDENWDFRCWLKGNADEDEFDAYCKELHEKYFTGYPCSQCNNCCKMSSGVFTEAEVETAAAELNMDPQQFIRSYLKKDRYGEDEYEVIRKPCAFFRENICQLDEAMPRGCREFPFTDKPDRISSLGSMLFAVEICPVAYTIWEDLKQIYQWPECEEEDADMDWDLF